MNANSSNQKAPNGPSAKTPIETSAARDGGDMPKQQIGQVDQIAQNLLQDQQRLNRQLETLAKDLFKLWDEKGYGKMRLSAIIRSFMSLGFAASEEIIIGLFADTIRRK